MSTKIEWANPPGYGGESWNPITGCSPVSPGCDNCWARRMAQRQPGRNGYPLDNPFRPGTVHEDKMEQPLHWVKPRCIFVCSMGDLFHDDVPDSRIQRVLDVADECPQHRFLLLTKRPKRMRDVLQERYSASPECGEPATGPAENLAVGVSVEGQYRADERIPLLLQCPAAGWFVSVEPMLGPVDLCLKSLKPTREYEFGDATRARIHWVIIGCESGPKRRPCDHGWVGDLLDQCAAASVPAFVKQMDIDGRVSHDPAEWPWRRRVRQWPGFLLSDAAVVTTTEVKGEP